MAAESEAAAQGGPRGSYGARLASMAGHVTDQVSRAQNRLTAAVGSALDSPIRSVMPKENVYSYFTFVWPIETASGEATNSWCGFTVDKLMAIVLVLMALAIQSVLLTAIFSNVVAQNAAWQEGILRTNGMNEGAFSGILGLGNRQKCVEPDSLCVMLDDGMSCAPPTIQLTSRWAELDLNGDGIWNWTEALKINDDILCRYGVGATEAFRVIQDFVIRRYEYLWIHPDLRSGTAMHKPYFTYAMGDIVMCGYRDHHICANLIQRGIFDSPMLYHTVPRIGNTTSSAMDYCYDLLEPGGQCERVLPSAYSVWKVVSMEECGDAEYEKFIYEHPETKRKKSLLSVNFDAREEYQKAQTPLFLIYKFSLILVWLLAMVNECKDVALTCTLILRFPSAAKAVSDRGRAVEEEEQLTPRGTATGEKLYKIHGITHLHRVLVGAAAVLRSVMLFVLTVVGTDLLLRNTSYVDLLFDAVSLVFVLEIANILYSHVLRLDAQEKAMRAQPMQVKTVGFAFANKHPGYLDLMLLGVTMALAVYIMYVYNKDTVKPIFNALDCACLGQGEQCHEAKTFSNAWWNDYWRYQTPKVFDDLVVLKEELRNKTVTEQAAAASGGAIASLAWSPRVKAASDRNVSASAPKVPEALAMPRAETQAAPSVPTARAQVSPAAAVAVAAPTNLRAGAARSEAIAPARMAFAATAARVKAAGLALVDAAAPRHLFDTSWRRDSQRTRRRSLRNILLGVGSV